MARRIESHMIPGPAGRLESLLEEPETGPPSEAALICHPHPRHGGTMHNKVVYRLARALRRAGAVALRFNYRGVNLSEGAYDYGIGELEDARAALAWLRERYPALPCTVAGFSFGSRISLKLGSQAGAARILAVGLPEAYQAELAGLDWGAAPKYFVQSTNDEYGPRPGLESFVGALPEPKRLVWIESRDHFFAGGLEGLEAAIAALPTPQLASE
jgi:alpha/beta superfamily hydrolase